MTLSIEPALSNAIHERPSLCEFELQIFSKYEDATTEASGLTLAIGITHALPNLRHIAHSRAVFGARRMPKSGRTYGSHEVVFPDEEDRPTMGYDQFAVRQAIGFDDEIEVFDVLEEFDEAEGVLRYRAQDLGTDDRSLEIIAEGVQEYIETAYNVMLWDPKARLDIAESLDDLFLERDWTRFVSIDDLKIPVATVSDVELLRKSDDDEWLVRFHYVNGDDSGFELEFADLKRGRLKIRRDAYSALRSPVPAFRGDQLPQVYEALQAALDRIEIGSVEAGNS